MEFTKNNRTGYTQAIISILIIFCTFMPFYKGGIDNGYYSYYKTTSAMLEFTTYLAINKKVYLGIFFVISMMLQLINIFAQPRKNNAILPILAGITGGISILMLHSQIDEVEKNGIKISYSWGFFLMLALMALQIIIQIISNKEADEEKLTHDDIEKLFKQEETSPCEKDKDLTAEVTPETESAAAAPEPAVQNMNKGIAEQLKKEMQETDKLKEELRMLKAKAEQIEMEKKLQEEIAQLKEMLKNDEKNA